MLTMWGRARVARLATFVLVTTLVAGCGGDDTDTADDAAQDGASATTSASASESVTPPASGSLTTPPAETTSPAVPAECTPPTEEVTYGAGAASLDISAGEFAGTHELTTEPEKTDASVYQTGFGDQLIGQWRGTLEDELPVLEVRMLDEGSGVCEGRPIVRLYLPFLAYTDEESTACEVTLATLTATAVVGSFTCSGIPRVFGSKDPAALDVAGTFSLGT